MIILENIGTYDFTYLLDKYKYPQYNIPDMLYHNTQYENVDSISKHGLRIDKARQLEYDGNFIWCVTNGGGSGYGGCTIAFKNKHNDNYVELNDTEYGVYEDVKASDIIFIDTWILNDESFHYRLSDMPRLIKKFGIEKNRKVIQKYLDRGVESFYDIDKLLDVASRQ